MGEKVKKTLLCVQTFGQFRDRTDQNQNCQFNMSFEKSHQKFRIQMVFCSKNFILSHTSFGFILRIISCIKLLLPTHTLPTTHTHPIHIQPPPQLGFFIASM